MGLTYSSVRKAPSVRYGGTHVGSVRSLPAHVIVDSVVEEEIDSQDSLGLILTASIIDEMDTSFVDTLPSSLDPDF